MQYRIASPKAEPLQIGTLLEKLHMNEESDPEDIERVGQLAGEAQALAKPRAMYRVAPIDEHGEDFVRLGEVRFSSALVAENLKDCGICVPYVATCGTELAAWADGFRDDFLAQFWADAIMLEYHAQAVQALNREVAQEVFGGKPYASMNPGSLPVWPISEQVALFRALGAEDGLLRPIGVRLKKSFLMVPEKSVSGIFFTNETGYVNCRMCPKASCPNRRAPYQEG